jgi:hypothetical protein
MPRGAGTEREESERPWAETHGSRVTADDPLGEHPLKAAQAALDAAVALHGEDGSDHHLDVRLLTAYQLAIEFKKLCPDDVKKL